ncbi:MAG: ferredoxin, partial [Acidobacteriota bacterium]
MAQSTLRVAENAPGDWFVDSTCIDCDACRQIAPAVFRDAGDYSAVHHQPSTPFELLAAQKALLTCPTASIGSETRTDMRGALAAYPEVIAEDVYRCGFTSQSSFGAFSYLIRAARPARPAALVGKASAGVFV